MSAPGPASAQIVVLGAGRAVRGRVPPPIVAIDARARVLDWLLDAFVPVGDADCTVVGGYRAEEIAEHYPHLRLVVNREWKRTGPAHSLALVPFAVDRPLYVTYSDVVYRRDVIERVAATPGPIALAVDSLWRHRYDRRGPAALSKAEKVALDAGVVTDIGPHLDTAAADAEFCGIVRFDPPALEVIRTVLDAGAVAPRAGLPSVLRAAFGQGIAAHAVDVRGHWAELDARQDLARFVLGTKAESLARLAPMQHGGEIGRIVAFTRADWQRDPDPQLERIRATFGARPVIVRSSALAEDSWTESAAGQHESILDVAPTRAALHDAIVRVFASYRGDDPNDQVLVQEMLADVAMSGVIMTRTHALGAPYYVVNFDDRTHRTDTVTAGLDARTLVLFRDAPLPAEMPVPPTVLAVAQNIEKLVGHDSLDIEFAVTADERVHVLQVRPIAVQHLPDSLDDEAVATALASARTLLSARAQPLPQLVGRRWRYSVMSDWNPAEIVGTKPRRLALSLYRTLITDEVWARQRAEYGYRDVRPCPLLVEIAGHPYVDVRASLNSFVPATVDDELATRLVDHCLARLDAQPELHDKIEFAVAITCLTTEFDARAAALRAAGFTADDIETLRDGLGRVTQHALDRTAGDSATVDRVDAAINRLTTLELAPLDAAFVRLDLVRRGATLVFAHLARSAFVATDLLRGMVATGVLDRGRVESFLATIGTVFGRLQSDAGRVRAGELPFATLVDRYGHLRPGTYDILSPSYREASDQYLRPLAEREIAVDVAGEHVWDPGERAAIDGALHDLGLQADTDAFDRFARAAISGREYAKFVFTRAVSAALDDFVRFGEAHGLRRDELADLHVDELFAARDALVDPAAFLHRRASDGREQWNVAQAISLPGQLARLGDLTGFEQVVAEANFVTQLAVEAEIVDLASDPDAEVAGRIVLIPSADPGYDGVLARGIAGLVTMYGGANSHMAVRAAECGIPAAIGVGEVRYEALTGALVIRLDCASRTIAVIA